MIITSTPANAVARPSSASPHPRDVQGRRFSEALLDLIDQKLGEDRSFGGGTMPRSVDVFNAHGFFAGATPDASAEMVATEGAPANDIVPAVNAPTAAPESPNPALVDGAPKYAGPIGDLDDRVPASIAIASPGAVEAIETPGPPESGANAIDIGSPAFVATTGDAFAEELPAAIRDIQPVTLVRDDALNASSLRITLAQDAGGVTIAIAGGQLSESEGGELHEAVRGLLAQHGLALSDLRIVSRAASGDRGMGRGNAGN